MTVDVLAARNDWEQGYRRLLDEARDALAGERLYTQLDAVTAELRRRIGVTFTLGDLAEAYAGSERWAGEAVAEHAPVPGWTRTLALVGDAAFHLYARGAMDYSP